MSIYSNYKMLTFFTFFIILIKTNNVKAAGATTQIDDLELSFKCERIQRGDYLSMSDPVIKTYEKEIGQTDWKLIHNTEVVRNNQNAQFETKLVTPYRFQEKFVLKFEVYDKDKNKLQFLGRTDEVTLGVLVTRRTNPLDLKDHNGKEVSGKIIVVAIALGGDTSKVTLKMSGTKLEKIKNNFLRKTLPLPFLQIYKKVDDDSNEYVIVWSSPPTMQPTDQPKWEQFEIPVWLLCNGKRDRGLKFVCSHFSSSGTHKPIGEFYTNMNDLAQKFYDNARTNRLTSFDIFKEDKKTGQKIMSGELLLENFKAQPPVTFVDYIQDEIEISCVVAIDFTASNHDEGLHNINKEDKDFLNSYEIAIWGIVSILEDYDTDRSFPVYGFGGHFADTEVFHDIIVNGTSDPHCIGVQGVLNAYRSCLEVIYLKGPTWFSPIINKVVLTAQHEQEKWKYHTLLILTDGVLDPVDWGNTIEQIYQASLSPISIIIVGIGNANFTAMKQLDADTAPLKNSRGQRIRDIVQFVELREFSSNNRITCFKNLAANVLAEVPNQLVSYMLSKKLYPRSKDIPYYYK